MPDDTPTLPHPYTYRAASVETMLQAVADLTSKWPPSIDLDTQVATYPNITCVPGGDHPQSIGLSLASLEGGNEDDRDDLHLSGEYNRLPANTVDAYEPALDAQLGGGTEIERDDDMANIEW